MNHTLSPSPFEEDDLEPIPLNLPHQTVHRVSISSVSLATGGETNKNGKNTYTSSLLPSKPSRKRSNQNAFHKNSNRKVSKPSAAATPSLGAVEDNPQNLISDSDGAQDDDEEDEDDKLDTQSNDDFHSAASQDEFQLTPDPMDVIFGRGQPLRDHPGNMRMRDIIKRYTNAYRTAAKQEKTKLIQQITQAIAANGARFLVPCNNQDPSEGCKPAALSEIRSKISHGLRDAIKVEDLLDSEFVQLWSTAPPPPEPQTPPLQPFSVASPSTSLGGLQHHRSLSYNGFSSPSYPNDPLSNYSPASRHMSLQPQHAPNFPLFSQQERSLSVAGPAIFHVSVPNATDKTDEVDDDSLVDMAEKGLSPSRNGHNHQDHPVAISAVAMPASSRWSKCTQVLLALSCVVIVGLLVLVGFAYANDGKRKASSSTNKTGISSETMDEIMARGVLRCGLANQVGYSARDPLTGRIEGFEVDLCRAVAAGMFGREKFSNVDSNGPRDEEPVDYVFLDTRERFTALASKKVDVLLAITSHNMERQVFESTTMQGFSFSTPYLLNGVIFAGKSDYLPCVEEEWNSTGLSPFFCDDLRVCVLDFTTHANLLEQGLPSATLVRAPTYDSFYQLFRDGDCDLLAGEQVDLFVGASPAKNLSLVYDDFVVGSTVYSKEPIAMVTRHDDTRFSDFCNWIVQALFAAEEVQLDASRASLSDLPVSSVFGERFSFMFHDAITVVGDYGAIYERHLQKYVPRSRANEINVGGSPAMFALPFGNLQTTVASPQLSRGTLGEIRERGHLKCGITQASIFAEFDDTTEDYEGLDASYCQALSAAIFDGTVNVRYSVLDPSERFVALAEKSVDVLARVTTITLERDVHEPTTGKGFTFSPPNFFDEIHFAGLPDFLECAETMNATGYCDELLVCVTQNTTQSQRMEEVLDSKHIMLSTDTSENIERFVKGECNVIAGGFVEVIPSNVAALGYTGPYEIGTTAYSRESLALVTLEEDVVWSNFVNWVVIAILHAEEQNITQDTYYDMPRVDLFKPLVSEDMFRNVIRTVGSYSEIWEKVASSKGVLRQGRNLLNKLPMGPQLISDLLWDRPTQVE